MTFDPLEQFNIIGFCKPQHSAFIPGIFDSVSIVGMLNVLLFSAVSLTVLSTKPTGFISYRNIFLYTISELKVLISSNMVFKKPIFSCYLISLFFFILFSNVFGMIPYSVTVTSFFVISFFCASVTFIGSTITGLKYNKIKFFSVFLPGGVPLVISIFLIIIEMISYFSKVLSLSIRLFANMMSGHTLLKILLGFSWLMLISGQSIAVFGLIPLFVVFCVTFLECMIAFLQAYIFIVLSLIYFNDVVNLH